MAQNCWTPTKPLVVEVVDKLVLLQKDMIKLSSQEEVDHSLRDNSHNQDINQDIKPDINLDTKPDINLDIKTKVNLETNLDIKAKANHNKVKEKVLGGIL